MVKRFSLGFLFVLEIFIIFFVENVSAEVYYLSPNGSDSGNGSFEDPWFSLNYALNKYANDYANARVSSGDTLYLRGGVYDITAMSKQADKPCPYIVTNQAPEDARITIKSYPGEWAILDGGEDRSALRSNYEIYNITFEDMEVRNCLTAGFHFGFGYDNPYLHNCIFRNIYFHNNTHPDVNSNPAGLRLACENCTIEYCTFENNGVIESSHLNSANLILYNRYSSFPELTPRRNNVVRYCFFDGGGSSLKDKGGSEFVNSSNPNRTNEDWANEIHHNIFKNSLGQGYYSVQDFVEFHHNLLINCSNGVRVHSSSASDRCHWYNKIYANTFVNTNFAINIEDSPYGDKNGAFGHEMHSNLFYDCGEEPLLFWTGQNAHDFNVSSDFNVWDNKTIFVGRKLLDSGVEFNDWRGYGYGLNSEIGEVSFLNFSTNDYRLDSNSVGKNSAKDGRDVGAFDESNWYGKAGYFGLNFSNSLLEKTCGDSVCNGTEDCSNCPKDCLNSSIEICCSRTVYVGDCCDDSECGSGFECNLSDHLCYENQTQIKCVHEAEIGPCDGVISFTEIQDYLDRWLNGEITINQLLSGINEWRGFN